MRKKLIAANWKMYKTPDQARDFFRDFLPLVHGHDRDEIVVCPTYLAIDAAVHSAKGSNVAIGAQDVYWQKEGAFTGEICASMLVAVGVTHVIIGHSERRQHFGETDDTVNLKLKSSLEAGLIPIVCVGEVLEEREAGLTDDVLRRQCLRAFNKVSAKKAVSLVVAYEPAWAIGTGKTATPQNRRRRPCQHTSRSSRILRPGIRR
jgi:triosephosphate isomerase (TIM)